MHSIAVKKFSGDTGNAKKITMEIQAKTTRPVTDRGGGV